MNTSIEPKTGQWMLVVGPHSIRHMMMKVIAGLAAREPVRVVDGGASPKNRGGQPGWFEVAQYLRGKQQALDRIAIERAFSCHQVLALLERTSSMAIPFVVLDLLHTFYDGSVKIEERKRLLKGCLENLNRLEKCAGGVVSISPPRVRSKEAVELFKMVEEATSDTYRVEVVIPSPELQRLF